MMHATDNFTEFERVMAPAAVPPGAFSSSILTASELDALVIPPRESLVGTWWFTGALGFLFGPRGLGKTWLAVHLARCLAEGRDCGPWKIAKKRNVLYVDGEMPLAALRDQIREVFIHENYISQEDVELCIRCDLTPLANEPAFSEMKGLHDVLTALYSNLNSVETE
jgi:hypothetical protein